MATDQPAAAAAGTLDQSLELAAANAVVIQQQSAITRQAAVTSAAAAMLALFARDGETGAEAKPATAADLTAAAEAGAAAAAAAGSDIAFPRAAGFSAALAALDAGNVLAGVSTLTTLLSALALARYVATGDERFLAAAGTAEALLNTATSRFERVCSYAAGLGAPSAGA